MWVHYENKLYLFFSSFPVYTNLLCGYAYTLFVMDTMFALKAIRADKAMENIQKIHKRAKVLKYFVYGLMIFTMVVYCVEFFLFDKNIVNQMNMTVILVMYSIAGVIIGYFSIYFLVEMKREYGNKFVRPRNRVSNSLN